MAGSIVEKGRLVGTVRFGGGLNKQNKLRELRAQGYVVSDRGDFALYYEHPRVKKEG